MYITNVVCCDFPNFISTKCPSTTLSQLDIRTPVGVNDRGGDKKQKGEGAEEQNKQQGMGAREHGGRGEKSETGTMRTFHVILLETDELPRAPIKCIGISLRSTRWRRNNGLLAMSFILTLQPSRVRR
jgi:hypothetical protein